MKSASRFHDLSAVPATIGRVTVGRNDGHGSIDSITTAGLSFSTAPSSVGGGFVIHAASSVVSDAIPFQVSAGETVDVDIYVESGAAPTIHNLGLQKSYLSPPLSGDFTGAPTSDGYPTLTQHRLIISSLDVKTQYYGGVLVAVGDSITVGDGQTEAIDLNERYPDYLQADFATKFPNLSVVNAGIAANQVVGDGNAFFWGPSLLHRFDRDVLQRSGLSAS